MLRSKSILVLLCLPLFLLSSCSSTPSRNGAFYTESHLPLEKWKRDSNCCTSKGRDFAIASGGHFSSQAGLEMINDGGNLVDAAVATAFALAVERPYSLGIGGGGFMVAHFSGMKDVFVDFRESAPAKASRNMFVGKDGKVIEGLSTDSSLAAGTPGFVAGLWEIHAKYGTLPWKRLLQPAIKLAREGFAVYPSLAHDMAANPKLFPKPFREGERFVQADLAKTLELVASKGRAGFYSGSVAKKIAAFTKKNQGGVDENDLKNYKVKFREPIVGKFRDLTFISASPPSAGGVMLAQMLGVLDPIDTATESLDTAGYAHLLSEVMKHAYADRSKYIGDPDYNKLPYKQLYSPEYVDSIRASLNREEATPSPKIQPKPEVHGTTSVSIMDNEGNAISMTLTINDHFGNKMRVPETGIILNNEMDDFSAKPGEPNIYGLTGGEANAIAPGKRPVSSMTPTIFLKDGEPLLAIGGAGGSRIISSVLQVTLNTLDVYPNDLRRALFAPRVHHQWLPDRFDLENGYSDAVRARLKSMGHTLTDWPFLSNVFAVYRDPTGVLTAGFDPREAGGAQAR